jgi:ATP-binding cassette subfamily F protein uup
MSIINGLDESDTGQVVLRKGIKMAFLSQNNNLQDELTIEESIFASDNETLKVIEAYEKHWNTQKTKKLKKAFDGMDRHNAWDFETQYRQILFKLKLEDFHLKVKTFQVDSKSVCRSSF